MILIPILLHRINRAGGINQKQPGKHEENAQATQSYFIRMNFVFSQNDSYAPCCSSACIYFFTRVLNRFPLSS